MDLLWPDSDPTAAVNNLNQTVFQLRRVLDPNYRDGISPQYVLSTADAVQLNPDLVTTDLDEFRRCASALGKSTPRSEEAIATLVAIVRGEFLAELRYEDWSSRHRTAVHAEVRETLLPALLHSHNGNADLAIRAGCALLELDPYDETVQLAVVERLGSSGRRPAARAAVLNFARRLKEDLGEPPSSELEEALARWAPRRQQSSSS